MKCDFVVGQKVVLIKPFPDHEIERAEADGVILPSMAVVYTVRDIEPGVGLYVGRFALRFIELVNPPHHSNGLEPAFVHTMFRPVVERKTDISIFKRMLTPAGGVPVDA